MAEGTSAASSPIPFTSGAGIEPMPQQNGDTLDNVAKGEHVESLGEGAEEEVQAEAAKTNGEAHRDRDETSGSPNPLMPDTEDSEMKDFGDAGDAPGAAGRSAASPANDTPVVSKRVSTGGSSRKRSSAIPEHKSKKLNRRKSKPLTNLHAQPGEYYMARMKGHPLWPSIICDEEMLPQSLLSTRPVTAALPDGSFKREEYADGGKRVNERTFPVMFLATNEFAWMPNFELTPLDVESDATKHPVEKGKSKKLLEAYKEAAENKDLAHFKGLLADHQKYVEEEEAVAAEKTKKIKKARKSGDTSTLLDNADEMDIDNEPIAEKPTSKKRKKVHDNDETEEKPAKTPKTATKLKLTTPKTPASVSSNKKKTSKPKAKPVKSGSEEDAVTPKVEEKPLHPGQLREIKEKKVLYYRHKLQRGFLSRDTSPKEDEMKTMSDFLGELETFPDLEVSIIRITKIHKVLKAMIKLPSIPLDEVFHIRTRCVKLLAKWHEILSNDYDSRTGATGDKEDEPKPEGEASAAALTTNGEASKDVEEPAEQAEVTGDAPTPEEESEGKLENMIGTTVEGDQEDEDSEQIKTTEEEKTDGPAIESAPGGEYKPPV